MSSIVTVYAQVTKFPALSVAVHITVVAPRLKEIPSNVVKPEAIVAPVSSAVTVTIPQLSVAVASHAVPATV